MRSGDTRAGVLHKDFDAASGFRGALRNVYVKRAGRGLHRFVSVERQINEYLLAKAFIEHEHGNTGGVVALNVYPGFRILVVSGLQRAIDNGGDVLRTALERLRPREVQKNSQKKQ